MYSIQLQTVERPRVCSAVHGTVHYIEITFEVIFDKIIALVPTPNTETQHESDFSFCLESIMFLANAKHLYNIYTMLDQRRRRWASVVQMLYKCFVFTGLLYVIFEFRILCLEDSVISMISPSSGGSPGPV